MEVVERTIAFSKTNQRCIFDSGVVCHPHWRGGHGWRETKFASASRRQVPSSVAAVWFSQHVLRKLPVVSCSHVLDDSSQTNDCPTKHFKVSPFSTFPGLLHGSIAFAWRMAFRRPWNERVSLDYEMDGSQLTWMTELTHLSCFLWFPIDGAFLSLFQSLILQFPEFRSSKSIHSLVIKSTQVKANYLSEATAKYDE